MGKVSDIFNSKVTPVSIDTPVIQAAQQMLISRSGVVPVCNHGRFLGVVNERNIIVSIVAVGREPVTEPVGSVTEGCDCVVSPAADVLQAAQMMARSGRQVLPVVQDGKLLGLFSLEDLARESQALAALVYSKIVGHRGFPEREERGP